MPTEFSKMKPGVYYLENGIATKNGYKNGLVVYKKDCEGKWFRLQFDGTWRRMDVPILGVTTELREY